MWNFLKCLAISFFPAFCMFALLCVVVAESTFTSDKEENVVFYAVLAICIGIIILLMYVSKTDGMW